MIEADVSYDPVAKKPIMAHPPAVISDLTLEEFLKKVKDNGKKGIKLDFKSFDAFNTSVEVLQKTEVRFFLLTIKKSTFLLIFIQNNETITE